MEILVVVAILAVIAAVVMPRMLGHERRAFELAADQVAGLMSAFAQRDALAHKPAGLWHDAQRNWIVLLVLDIDQTRPQEPPDWLPDPFVPPVKLPPGIPPDGVFAATDGDPFDLHVWPIATTPGRTRPRIEMELRSDDGAVATLVLPAHAMAPYRLQANGELAEARQVVDLDAIGRSREDW